MVDVDNMRSLVTFALVALAIAVVALAGWMLGRAAPPAAGIAQTVQVEDLRVTVQLDQAALGSRIVNVTVQDANDRPLDLSAVRLRFTMPEMDMGTIEADAQPIGQGRFQASGMFFTMAGRWTVDTTLVRDGRPPIRATFTFPIAAPGEASGPLNPLTADVWTIQAGQQLYQANCTPCHGAAGRGDGPLAAGLSPRPADFTQHMVPGKHTDGQVYLWIKDGFPGTAMPSWGQRLTETQIWQLVTYLRTFGQHTAVAPAASPKQPTAPALAVPLTAIPDVQEPLPPLIFARQANLWRSNGSGDPPQQLTNLGADGLAEHPTVSPDGTRIAFITLAPAPITATLPISISALYVMNADGSNPHALWKPPRGLLALPTWTPDSQALYVGLSDILSDPMAPVPERLLEVVRVDLATGARRVVLEDARDPTIARDGKRIAYLHFDKQNAAFSLHIAAPDGSGDRELIGAGAFTDFYAPRFSPDGKRIIVAAIGGPVTNDQGYPINASEQAPLQRLLALFEPPVAEAHGASWDLWMVNTDGTGLRRLPMAREDTPMVAFAPDGSRIVMMGAGGIYLMDADGSNMRRIDPLGDHGGLDWAQK